MKIRPMWLGIVALLLAIPAPALAFVAQSGKTVVISEAIPDDLYAAGGTVTVTAPVEGDVVAAGGTMNLDGKAGGVLAVGGTLRVDGPVGRSVRAVAGTLVLVSRVGNDAVLSGGNVTVEPSARIGRDLVIGAGNATVFGTVGRNLMVGSGDVSIGGLIRGDAEVRASRVVLLRTARIAGTLRYSADQPMEIQPGAQVTGGTVRIALPSRPAVAPASPRFWLGEHLAELLALLAVGLIVFGVAPRAASAVVRQIRERFGRSFLIGLLLLAAVPVAALLALFTIIGIPLSVTAMLLYVATLYVSQVFVAAWVGHVILSRARHRAGPPLSSMWAVVVGAIVLILLFAIPYAGWTLRMVAVLVGFGALWFTVWSAAASRSPAVIEAPR